MDGEGHAKMLLELFSVNAAESGPPQVRRRRMHRVILQANRMVACTRISCGYVKILCSCLA